MNTLGRLLGLPLMVAGVIVVMAGCAQPSAQTPLAPGQQPNILIILTDDQRYDTMDYMPQTKALIFDKGITFSKGYVTTPLCCPSRAAILTGTYDHTNGVLTNTDALSGPTFVNSLHAAGYYTGMIGKYLNSWDGTPRPEFDFWIGSVKREYHNPHLNINGTWQQIQGYDTTILGGYALQFLDQAEKQGKPWLLYYSIHAPHAPATPDTPYATLYANQPPFRPPSFNEADISDKPYAQEIPLLTKAQIKGNDRFRLMQLRSLKTVDDTVQQIMQNLTDHKLLDNTAIFYLSDNGMMWGEHRIAVAKVVPYEPSIRVPFAFSYPRLGVAPRVVDRLVANIDIAPTIYELAGITQHPAVDGMSLIPLIRGQGTWRDDLLIESWGVPDLSPGDTTADLGTGRFLLKPYTAIHTDHYIYIDTIGYGPELYDLDKDPDEMQNVVNDPSYAQVVKDLAARDESLKGPFLARLKTLQADETTTPAATLVP